MADSYEEYELQQLKSFDIEVPQSLVSMLIGTNGHMINKITQEAHVKIKARQHHNLNKVGTHQIFEFRGPKHHIANALQLLRTEFPLDRFPNLSLQRVYPQFIPTPILPSSSLQYLVLPSDGVFPIYISAVMDVDHFFVQLPLHPSFKSLSTLDIHLTGLYYDMPKPSIFVIPPDSYENMMCVAPLNNNWFRAIALKMNESTGEMLVKFLDYGGFSHIPQGKLRFTLRPGTMELPFQAVECRLADVQPLNAGRWTTQAKKCFHNICTNKIVEAELIGHHAIDGLPYIRIFVKNKDNKFIRFDKYLISQKCAKPWDASTCVFVDGTTV